MKIKTPILIKKFRVRSRHNHNTFYIVELWSDNKMYCDCMAGLHNRPCWHKKQVEEYQEIKKIGDSVN